MSFLVNNPLLEDEIDCYEEIYIADDFTAEINKSYILNAEKDLIISLPSTSCIKDTIQFRNIGDFTFTIVQSANQQIQIGELVTTFGNTGKIILDEKGCSLTLECVLEDSSWIVTELNSNVVMF